VEDVANFSKNNEDGAEKDLDVMDDFVEL